MYFDNLVNDYERLGGGLYPADEQDIHRLLDIWGTLPMAYIEFLHVMGEGTGNGFLIGHDCFIDTIFSLKSWALELLEENNETELFIKDTYFVFMMIQGMNFFFFDITDGDDPPVYLYDEEYPHEFRKISDTFSHMIIDFYNMLEQRHIK